MDYEGIWTEEMACEGGALTLTDQLSLAKEMGFSDKDILLALSLNCAKDGVYRPFSSTSAMVDMIARVQRICDPSSTTSVMIKSTDSGVDIDKNLYAQHTPPDTPTSDKRNSVILRHSTSSAPKIHEDGATSSNFDVHHRMSPPPFQLKRLLDAFERDRKNYWDESTRSVQMLQEKHKLLMEKHNLLQSRIIDKDTEIQRLKALLHDQTTFAEQLKNVKMKLDTQILENESKTNQIRLLTEQGEVLKKQHIGELRDLEKEKEKLLSQLSMAELASVPFREKQQQLQKEVDDLKRKVSEKQEDLDKCQNYHDEIQKSENRVKELQNELDQVRSTLRKVPTCVICLDKRPQLLYVPCSHFVCCEQCGNGFENCPTCRQKIRGKIMAFQ